VIFPEAGLITRRRMLQVGSLGLAGVTLPRLLQADVERSARIERQVAQHRVALHELAAHGDQAQHLRFFWAHAFRSDHDLDRPTNLVYDLFGQIPDPDLLPHPQIEHLSFHTWGSARLDKTVHGIIHKCKVAGGFKATQVDRILG